MYRVLIAFYKLTKSFLYGTAPVLLSDWNYIHTGYRQDYPLIRASCYYTFVPVSRMTRIIRKIVIIIFFSIFVTARVFFWCNS